VFMFVLLIVARPEISFGSEKIEAFYWRHR